MTYLDQLRRIHDLALAQRVQGGYDVQSLPFTMIPFMAPDQPDPPLTLAEGLSDEARSMMPYLSRSFKEIGVACVIISADSRVLDAPKFAKEFKIKLTPIEQFQRNYSRILSEQFNGRMSNLPPTLYTDSVTSFMKGPKVPVSVLNSKYHRSPEGGVLFSPTIEFSGGEGVMNIIPDWWDSTIQ